MIVKITPLDGEELSQIQVGDVLIFGKVKQVQALTNYRGKLIPVYTPEQLTAKFRETQ